MELFPAGAIFQQAYVVPDLDAAILAWSERLGVGPFVIYRHHPFRSAQYRGQATNIDISLAFAFSGDTNIELIQVHDGAPSVYSDFVARKGYGLQHIGLLSDTLDADGARFAAAGIAELQRTVDETGIETRFFDTEALLGVTVELIHGNDMLRDGFQQLKAMASGQA